jgi:hypothetical protein
VNCPPGAPGIEYSKINEDPGALFSLIITEVPRGSTDGFGLVGGEHAGFGAKAKPFSHTKRPSLLPIPLHT